MYKLTDFWNIHKGKTALLVGNGPNLRKTPPEWFDYISFGLNTIYKYPGWRPDYFVGVDRSLWENHGDKINEAYPDILKFIPSPNLDMLQGENYIRFKQRPGRLFVGGCLANNRDGLERGIGYANVMTAAMQIAWHMGFSTLLLIGVEQKPEPEALTEHFWGRDVDMPRHQTDVNWNIAYSHYVHSMTGVRILNISQDTYVPENILPRGDWRDWRNVFSAYGAKAEPELRHDDVIYSGFAPTSDAVEIPGVLAHTDGDVAYTDLPEFSATEDVVNPVMSTKPRKPRRK